MKVKDIYPFLRNSHISIQRFDPESVRFIEYSVGISIDGYADCEVARVEIAKKEGNFEPYFRIVIRNP